MALLIAFKTILKPLNIYNLLQRSLLLAYVPSVPFKEWAKTFANDSTLASAVVDRIVHHCETITIVGISYRLKGQLNPDET